MKKITKFLAHRVVIVGFLLCVQFLILLLMITIFKNYFFYFSLFSVLLSSVVVIYILSSKTNPGYKIAWIIPIIIFPIFGGLLYLLFGGNKLSKREKRKMKKSYHVYKELCHQNKATIQLLKESDRDAYTQSYYMYHQAFSPTYQNTETTYFKLGEEIYESILTEIKQATKFIFMEFFIINQGKMWDTILELLEQKVKEGVDVRLLYDDMGCIMTLPKDYYKVLREKGIKCTAFNPFIPILTTRLNNRNHRKIIVIDGKIAYTGGINLADEYINEIEKYGHWKDNGVMLKGEAVWSFTVMFLSLWDYVHNIEEDYYKFQAPREINMKSSDGFVIPYSDTPMDEEATGETVYMNMINRAKKYVYITTPYLIIDHEMVTALCNASKSGIDVRIITPGIPDKIIVNEVTKAYYEILIDSGIKIYEYTPGFIHAKTFISDDKYATVGTVNLDYRSLYLHFECGVWMYKTSCISNILEDYRETLKVCKEITKKDCRKVNVLRRVIRAILRIFAPLM